LLVTLPATLATEPGTYLCLNGTERPGAVYLAAVLAAHAQKGLPAFGIHGRDDVERGS
jgi:L-fucose isomerase